MKNTAKRVNTVAAKNQLNALIEQANRTRSPVIIEKRGQPVAVILDFQTFQNSENKLPAKDLSVVEDLRRFHEYMKKKYPQGTGDSVEIIRQMREERAAKWK